jgi:predicted permease
VIELLLLALTIVASASVGAVSRRRSPARAELLSERLIRFVLWVVLPPCVFVNVAHFDLTSGAGAGLLLGLGCLAFGGSAALVATRVLALPPRSAGAVICCSIVGNTGYFGLPATLVVFGSGAVTTAAGWDALLTGPVTFIVGFAVGAYFGEDDGAGMGERAWLFLRRNPVLWVLFPALLMPSSAIPHLALDISHIAFLALVPVGFYILGVSLALPVASGAESLVAPVGVAVVIRLAMVPALFAVGAGVVGRIPDSYYIQASAA